MRQTKNKLKLKSKANVDDDRQNEIKLIFSFSSRGPRKQ